MLWHVLDDEVLAADAERRLALEIQRARIPPDDRVAFGERVLTGTNGRRPGRLVVRPLQHRVLRCEGGTSGRTRRLPARFSRRIERVIERPDPSAVPRIVA